MKIIIISLILITSIPLLFAAPPVLAPPLAPKMQLKPLCYTDRATCYFAEKTLRLPDVGNFQLFSKCREANQFDAQAGRCYNFKFVLEIFATIDLPYLKQWQWRNQCFPNHGQCNDAKKIFAELAHPHPNPIIIFNASCMDAFNPPWRWNMTPQRMDEIGIFQCTPQNGPVELRVQAVRNR